MRRTVFLFLLGGQFALGLHFLGASCQAGVELDYTEVRVAYEKKCLETPFRSRDFQVLIGIDGADRLEERWQKHAEEDGRYRVLLGLLAEERGDNVEALRRLQPLDDSFFGLFHWARILNGEGGQSEAVDVALRHALGLAGTPAEVLGAASLLSSHLVEANRLKDAYAMWTEVWSERGSPEERMPLIEPTIALARELGRIDEWKQSIRTANPDDAFRFLYLAEAHRLLGSFGSMRESIDEIPENVRNKTVVLKFLGSLHRVPSCQPISTAALATMLARREGGFEEAVHLARVFRRGSQVQEVIQAQDVFMVRPELLLDNSSLWTTRLPQLAGPFLELCNARLESEPADIETRFLRAELLIREVDKLYGRRVTAISSRRVSYSNGFDGDLVKEYWKVFDYEPSKFVPLRHVAHTHIGGRSEVFGPGERLSLQEDLRDEAEQMRFLPRRFRDQKPASISKRSTIERWSDSRRYPTGIAKGQLYTNQDLRWIALLRLQALMSPVAFEQELGMRLADLSVYPNEDRIRAGLYLGNWNRLVADSVEWVNSGRPISSHYLPILFKQIATKNAGAVAMQVSTQDKIDAILSLKKAIDTDYPALRYFGANETLASLKSLRASSEVRQGVMGSIEKYRPKELVDEGAEQKTIEQEWIALLRKPLTKRVLAVGEDPLDSDTENGLRSRLAGNPPNAYNGSGSPLGRFRVYPMPLQKTREASPKFDLVALAERAEGLTELQRLRARLIKDLYLDGNSLAADADGLSGYPEVWRVKLWKAIQGDSDGEIAEKLEQWAETSQAGRSVLLRFALQYRLRTGSRDLTHLESLVVELEREEWKQSARGDVVRVLIEAGMESAATRLSKSIVFEPGEWPHIDHQPEKRSLTEAAQAYSSLDEDVFGQLVAGNADTAEVSLLSYQKNRPSLSMHDRLLIDSMLENGFVAIVMKRAKDLENLEAVYEVAKSDPTAISRAIIDSIRNRDPVPQFAAPYYRTAFDRELPLEADEYWALQTTKLRVSERESVLAAAARFDPKGLIGAVAQGKQESLSISRPSTWKLLAEAVDENPALVATGYKKTQNGLGSRKFMSQALNKGFLKEAWTFFAAGSEMRIPWSSSSFLEKFASSELNEKVVEHCADLLTETRSIEKGRRSMRLVSDDAPMALWTSFSRGDSLGTAICKGILSLPSASQEAVLALIGTRLSEHSDNRWIACSYYYLGSLVDTESVQEWEEEEVLRSTGADPQFILALVQSLERRRDASVNPIALALVNGVWDAAQEDGESRATAALLRSRLERAERNVPNADSIALLIEELSNERDYYLWSAGAVEALPEILASKDSLKHCALLLKKLRDWPVATSSSLGVPGGVRGISPQVRFRTFQQWINRCLAERRTDVMKLVMDGFTDFFTTRISSIVRRDTTISSETSRLSESLRTAFRGYLEIGNVETPMAFADQLFALGRKNGLESINFSALNKFVEPLRELTAGDFNKNTPVIWLVPQGSGAEESRVCWAIGSPPLGAANYGNQGYAFGVYFREAYPDERYTVSILAGPTPRSLKRVAELKGKGLFGEASLRLPRNTQYLRVIMESEAGDGELLIGESMSVRRGSTLIPEPLGFRTDLDYSLSKPRGPFRALGIEQSDLPNDGVVRGTAWDLSLPGGTFEVVSEVEIRPGSDLTVSGWVQPDMNGGGINGIWIMFRGPDGNEIPGKVFTGVRDPHSILRANGVYEWIHFVVEGAAKEVPLSATKAQVIIRRSSSGERASPLRVVNPSVTVRKSEADFTWDKFEVVRSALNGVAGLAVRGDLVAYGSRSSELRLEIVDLAGKGRDASALLPNELGVIDKILFLGETRRFLLFGNQKVSLWDGKTGKLVQHPEQGDIATSVAVSMDGTMVAFRRDSVVEVRETQTWKEIARVVLGQGRRSNDLFFFVDGDRRLALITDLQRGRTPVAKIFDFASNGFVELDESKRRELASMSLELTSPETTHFDLTRKRAYSTRGGGRVVLLRCGSGEELDRLSLPTNVQRPAVDPITGALYFLDSQNGLLKWDPDRPR